VNACSLLFSAAAALGVMLGTSGALLTTTTDAQAQVRVTVYKPGTQQYYESRMKMCNDNVKGIYRSQQDGFVQPLRVVPLERLQ